MNLHEATMKDDPSGRTSRLEEGGTPPPDRRAGRRSFLIRGAAAAGAAAVAGLAGRDARASNPNYLPSLYANENVMEFQAIQAHENAHVAFLVKALGADARPMPSFVNLAQANLLAFATTSRALENTGVGAYLGAAPYISNPTYLAAAGSILTIEARHAGYLDVLLNTIMTSSPVTTPPMANQSFETPLTAAQVLALAGPFFTSFNGGTTPGYSTTDLGPANDIAILNFALALEYLEQAFYNLNVPMFT